MKKFTALLLCLCMIISLVPTLTFANDNANMTFKDGYTYYVLSPDNITELGG